MIKLWTSYGVNEEYIKKKITQTLASLPVERIHHFTPVHEETSQPILESPLPGASAAASSSHAAPKQPQTSAHKQTQPVSQKEGCYIATCVYGSYDCPQVRLLRRFRDEHMKKTPAGRIFIRLYYAVSPVLVRYFGKSPAFHVFWRHILDSLIRRLESGR
nr:CFI-box-CTERM domain-containing protein [uncultured Enterocloster sp.]